MTDTLASTLTPEWKDRLGLTHRRSPELYESADAVNDVPHAPAIRAALNDMGVSAIFCVQGVPTVAILEADHYDRGAIIDLHGSLWNQGLASLLLVIAEGTLRAFSLARTPLNDPGEAFEARCLIDSLSLTAEALRFQNLIYGVESGRLWKDYGEYFPPKERIDQVLLDNLNACHDLLQKATLAPDAAQALLIQTMFIAYLEDREIVTPAYFAAVSGKRVESFSALLETGDIDLFRSFFTTLHADFNGDLFVAPCSFEPLGDTPEVAPAHLTILARFRSGREEMAHSGQQRFWGYDFRYIPIELVSAVYDRFLGEREAERRANGAYYTPMFLADTIVSQAWEMLPDTTRTTGSFLDPACGSGVFLVRSFQRLCEHWRAKHKTQTISWKTLLSLLSQIHGWDLNSGAVRVAVFSLYVALLEEVSPRDIRKLITRGKLLPELWGKTLVCRDFFEVSPDNAQYEVIIGNPPWTSRRGAARSSVQWSKKAGHPMPGGEDAWAFSWKALSHLAEGGLVAFLLPAMGFLHNHAQNTIEARDAFFQKSQVRRIINFADLRFQLFEKAHRPAALIIYGSPNPDCFPYRFDYWAPKADLNLRIKRVITLSNADKAALGVGAVLDNPLIFKQRLWMREPDAKLFGYLARLPKLGAFVSDYGSLSRRREEPGDRWVIGQGYQPFNENSESNAPPLASEYVGRLPDLPISAYSRLAQTAEGLQPAGSSTVRRRGFEAGFDGPRILIPRGVETSQNRLRAAYCDQPLTFQHIFQAIVVPNGQSDRAKVLTAILNSRIAVWYAFHGTASFGSDRPEVQQADLLRLPFPSPDDVPDRTAAAQAARELIAIVDEARERSKAPFSIQVEDGEVLRTIDRLSYKYFCLSADEIALIEDTVETILPALQPHEGHYPKLWGAPGEQQRAQYAHTLAASLADWFKGKRIDARLVARGADLAILRLRLGGHEDYAEDVTGELSDVLEQLAGHIHRPLDGNFQLMPDLRVFVGDCLHLIKPMQMRFWLRSTALADADGIALDLQQAAALPQQGGVD
ncbi:type I endonuclease-methyltransferase fusion protein [Novosphingobium indicum]|uniref:site-specific DNA-methyltransferase (adenine-specific) n=1 Tax=Novosphingobium indicum TaxID=462949 RepID=A0ABQ2JGN1_9SPHN|nr:N-6 DNA methylase [Novosphingobium indicum]GGN46462.1 type I endonuclease-methyltransferase fusion protein [Novosphingobium indicum]